MKIMPCPLNGERNIQEFVYGGEVVEQPDPNRCSDAEWAAFVFLEDNRAGVVREWWCHVTTAYWFIAERDTVKDEILRTYPASELFKERVELAAPEPPADAAPAVPAEEEVKPAPSSEAPDAAPAPPPDEKSD